jgi:hypothetical protein
MAGGFSSDLKVKKNKFVEEWNGKREITEKSFEVQQGTLPVILVTLILIPYGIYSLTRAEFVSSGHRRYKDMV